MKKAQGKSNLDIIRDYVDGTRPFIQVGYTGDSDMASRKEGEVWTDSNGKKWIKKNGFKKAINNVNSSIIDSIKQVCKDCGMEIKWGTKYDQKFFNKTGRCYDCLIKFESHLSIQGKFPDYEKKKVFSNQRSMVRDMIVKMEESLKYLNENEKISFVNGDGSAETWSMENREKMIKELKKDLKKANKALIDIDNQLNKLTHVEY